MATRLLKNVAFAILVSLIVSAAASGEVVPGNPQVVDALRSLT